MHLECSQGGVRDAASSAVKGAAPTSEVVRPLRRVFARFLSRFQRYVAVWRLHGIGVDPGARSPYGVTNLHRAALNGDVEVIELLCRAGVSPNVCNDNGETPLWTLVDAWTEDVRDDYAGTFAALIRAGADVNAANRGGVTPLLLAARVECHQVCEYLLEAGAECDRAATWSEGRYVTPLLFAVLGNNLPLCRLLVEHGASPHWMPRDPSAEMLATPLEQAVALSLIEVVRFFVDTCGDGEGALRGRPLIAFAVEGTKTHGYLLALKTAQEIADAIGDAADFPVRDRSIGPL